jgi:hypothetical protein
MLGRGAMRHEDDQRVLCSITARKGGGLLRAAPSAGAARGPRIGVRKCEPSGLGRELTAVQLARTSIDLQRHRCEPVDARTRAAPGLRSITRPVTYGPRSLIRTVTERPLRLLKTVTLLPIGSDLWAAVMALGFMCSPFAVMRSC